MSLPEKSMMLKPRKIVTFKWSGQLRENLIPNGCISSQPIPVFAVLPCREFRFYTVLGGEPRRRGFVSCPARKFPPSVCEDKYPEAWTDTFYSCMGSCSGK